MRAIGIQRLFGSGDYYAILGVARTASKDEIKQAYRDLAKIYHPDMPGSGEVQAAAQRFEQIAEAYTVLSHIDKRAKYDYDSLRSPEVLRGQLAEERGEDGSPVSRAQNRSQNDFALSYRERIEQQRRAFNISDFGTFKAGLPSRFRGKIRLD